MKRKVMHPPKPSDVGDDVIKEAIKLTIKDRDKETVEPPKTHCIHCFNVVYSEWYTLCARCKAMATFQQDYVGGNA